MDKRIIKVEAPTYLTEDEIREKYWEKQVLITNIQETPDHSRMHGGIVRYYATNSMKELWELLAYLRDTEGNDFIECCTVEYIGPVYLNLYAKGGVS